MKDTLSVRIRTAERRMALTLKAAKAADKPFVSFCCGSSSSGPMHASPHAIWRAWRHCRK